MRRMLIALTVVAALPLLLGGVLWLGQEKLIFLPDDRVIGAPPGWERPLLRRAGEPDLAFLVARVAPGRPVVLHFHGNGGNAEDRVPIAELLISAGYNIVLAEYRGYGGNAGRPGEADFGRDAEALLGWVRDAFPGAPLVLWGESLGTAIVTRLAERREGIAAVVLESPFTSVAALAAAAYPWLPTGLLLRHRFDSLAHVPGIAAPMLVVGSAADRLTPPDHAQRMAAAAREAELLILPGGAHPAVLNDAAGEGMRAVLDFIGRLR